MYRNARDLVKKDSYIVTWKEIEGKDRKKWLLVGFS